MTATSKQIAKLSDPTPSEEIGQIPGKGGSGALDYVTARFVQQRLDDSVGPENWQSYFTRVGDSLTCTISIYCGDSPSGWVEKQDVGTESKIESEKGNFSDAFKRAAVQWGIARDLYPGPKKTKAKAKPVEVVGTTDITDKQRSMIFALLKTVGWDKKRKSAAFLATTKNSFKQMTKEDAGRFIDILNYANEGASGNADFDEVIDNIGLVEADSDD